MRHLLPLTLLLAMSGTALAQNVPNVTFTPLPGPATSTVTAMPTVKLPETPELKKTVSLTVPLGGLTLEQALTVIGRAAGLSVLTQGLPQVTLRSGLSPMPARSALATLINLYAPNVTASVQGKLLIVGDAAAIARVRGQMTPGAETRVLRVPGFTDAQLARAQPFLTVRAALFDEGVVLLSGTGSDLEAAVRFLSSLPVQTRAAPATPVQPVPQSAAVTRTYTVAGDANLLAAAIREFTGASVTVLDRIVAVKGTEAQQGDALTLLKAAPAKPATTTPLTEANPVSRRSYASTLPDTDAAYLRALLGDLKITALPEQNLLVVEARASQHTDVASALKEAAARREARITSYYPVEGGKASDLIPTLKRETPSAEINAVEGRNMLAIRTTPAEQVRLSQLIRTLQGSPAADTTSKEDVITRSIKLGYADAASLAPDLARLTLASAQNSAPTTEGTVPQATAPGQTPQANGLIIIADARTNSLLVTGPRAQVTEMVNAVAMIDVPVPSVRVRLRVEQVSASDAQNLGVNWKLGLGGFSVGQQDGTLSVGYAPSLNPASIEVALNAAKSRGAGRTIIDSHFAALSGLDTQFQNGGELLFPATTIYNGQTPTVVPGQTYSYGLEIKVRPRIAPDGTVVMTLDTNLGSTPTTGPMGSVQQTKQTLVTSVQLKPGETVVLGGIVTDTQDQTQKGVPGLSSIPVIGALFGTRAASTSQNALLFIVSAEPVGTTRTAGTQSVSVPAPPSTPVMPTRTPPSSVTAPAPVAAPTGSTTAAPAPATRVSPQVENRNERGTESVEIPAEGDNK